LRASAFVSGGYRRKPGNQAARIAMGLKAAW
jgi:hypothetical protein